MISIKDAVVIAENKVIETLEKEYSGDYYSGVYKCFESERFYKVTFKPYTKDEDLMIHIPYALVDKFTGKTTVKWPVYLPPHLRKEVSEKFTEISPDKWME